MLYINHWSIPVCILFHLMYLKIYLKEAMYFPFMKACSLEKSKCNLFLRYLVHLVLCQIHLEGKHFSNNGSLFRAANCCGSACLRSCFHSVKRLSWWMFPVQVSQLVSKCTWQPLHFLSHTDTFDRHTHLHTQCCELFLLILLWQSSTSVTKNLLYFWHNWAKCLLFWLTECSSLKWWKD